MAEENSSINSNSYQDDDFEAPPGPSATPTFSKPPNPSSVDVDEDDEIIRAYREERDRFRLPPASMGAAAPPVAPNHGAAAPVHAPIPARDSRTPTAPPAQTFTPAAVTNIRQVQAFEQQFKRRFNALKKIYESRIDHLTNSIQKTFNAVNSDEVLLAMSEVR